MKTQRYTRTAIALHWLMAAGILGLMGVGIYMHELPLSPWKFKVYAWHKWAGVTVFLLLLVRLSWRLGHRPPALPTAMARWQQALAHGAHWLLYGLMAAIPLSGWLMSSAKGVPTVYFGVLPLPDLVSKNQELGKQLAELHEVLAFSMFALVAGHALAALKHHFIDRDGVLDSMRPFRKES